MGLTNAQYSEIMRTYDQHQLQNRALHASRMEQAYKSNPRLKEVDELKYQAIRKGIRTIPLNYRN